MTNLQDATPEQLNDELERRRQAYRLSKAEVCANCGELIEDVGEVVPGWNHIHNRSPYCSTKRAVPR